MIGKNIFLIGGGEIAKGDTREIDEKIISSAAKGSSFVFFGAAAGDAEGYAEIIKKTFGEHFDIMIASKVEGRQFAENAIKNASVIYLGGGETNLLMEHFENWNLTKLLIQAVDRGAVLVGMSAGAQVLSSWYVHEEGGLQEIRKGWNVVRENFGLLVHATDISYENAQKLVLDSKYSEDKLYGIGEGAALFVSEEDKDFVEIGRGKVWL